jgi:hypothetical protein
MGKSCLNCNNKDTCNRQIKLMASDEDLKRMVCFNWSED